MSAFAGFPSVTFGFLAGITKHNEKAWFDTHRAEVGFDADHPRAKLFLHEWLLAHVAKG